MWLREEIAKYVTGFGRSVSENTMEIWAEYLNNLPSLSPTVMRRAVKWCHGNDQSPSFSRLKAAINAVSIRSDGDVDEGWLDYLEMRLNSGETSSGSWCDKEGNAVSFEKYARGVLGRAGR